MGLFWKSYHNPGKGVSKDEPEKRGFFRFFELYFRNFWMLLSAELWYILLSLPIVTSGLAEVGMAYICRMAARDKHVFVVSDFFDAIKKNWKRALPIGIINAVLTAILIFNVWIFYINVKEGLMNSVWSYIVFATSVFFFIVFSFAKFYQYTLMITFDYDAKTIIKNSFLFSTLGIKHNLIIGGSLIAVYAAAIFLIVSFGQYGVWAVTIIGFFIFPAFRAFLIQFNVFPEIKKYIIDPYYSEHPDEDIEKRRELGVYEEPEDEEEAVFDDVASVDKEEL
jgi:uncharacterized membrane protein YesL